MEDITENLSFPVSNGTYHDVAWLEDAIETLSTYYMNNSLGSSSENVTSTVTWSSDPRRDPLYIVLPVTIIYVSIFFTGTIGNISTCFIIARNKSMHTATNYYLFSLAVSDLLLLVSGLPAEIYMVWSKYPYIFGEGFCVIRGLAAETSTNASVLTITAFTVERYLAICHPFFSQTMSKLSRAVKLILFVWVIAFLFALPLALQFGVVQLNSELVMCTMKRTLLQHSFELSTFLFFVVPMCLITVLYALIGLKLRKSNMMKRNSSRTETARNCRHHPGRSTRRVLKMLVAVVIAFFICWAPFHVQRLLAIYGTNPEDHITSNSKWMAYIYLLFTYISGVLYYISTTINPILYNIMSNKFRAAFMETLAKTCKIPWVPNRKERRSYSSLSRTQQQKMTNGVCVSRNPTVHDGAATTDSLDAGDIIRRTSADSITVQLMNNSSLVPQESNLTTDTEAIAVTNLNSIANGKLQTNDNSTERTNVQSSANVNVNTNVNADVKVNLTSDVNCPRRDSIVLTEEENSELPVQIVGNRCSYDQLPTEISGILGTQKKNELANINGNFEKNSVMNPEELRKKWWQMLKWLPKLRPFEITKFTNHFMTQSRASEGSENQEQNSSLAMCNIHERHERRHV